MRLDIYAELVCVVGNVALILDPTLHSSATRSCKMTFFYSRAVSTHGYLLLELYWYGTRMAPCTVVIASIRWILLSCWQPVTACCEAHGYLFWGYLIFEYVR